MSGSRVYREFQGQDATRTRSRHYPFKTVLALALAALAFPGLPAHELHDVVTGKAIQQLDHSRSPLNLVPGEGFEPPKYWCVGPVS